MVGVSGSCGILVSFDSNIARNGHINGSRISAGNLPPMPAEYTDKCRTKGYHKDSHFGLDFMSFRVSTYFVAEGYFIYFLFCHVFADVAPVPLVFIVPIVPVTWNTIAHCATHIWGPMSVNII